MGLKKSIVLSENDGFVERLSVETRDRKSFEMINTRFDPKELIAEIFWSSAAPGRGGTSTRLQAVNSIELRAFGVKCIELAAEMEVEQLSRG